MWSGGSGNGLSGFLESLGFSRVFCTTIERKLNDNPFIHERESWRE
jgi:hypothetical protein